VAKASSAAATIPQEDTSQHGIIDVEDFWSRLESNKSPSLFTSPLPLEEIPSVVKAVCQLRYRNFDVNGQPYEDSPNLGLFLNLAWLDSASGLWLWHCASNSQKRCARKKCI
jgi:hypothetical protein